MYEKYCARAPAGTLLKKIWASMYRELVSDGFGENVILR